MAYTINPAVFGSMFAVPSQIVDNNLKLASASQLKTLLWIFRHASEPIDPAVISREINYRESDVCDALTVLCEWGVIASDGNVTVQLPAPAPAPTPAAVSAPVATEIKKELPELALVKPSYDQVIARCEESPEIAHMFTDIEGLLGKTLGYDSECILLMMHDQYGLPVEVIYMLVSHCVSIGKGNLAYIAKVGKTWGEKEIDTIEKADEQITLLNACISLWKEFAGMAGIQNPRPTASQSAYLQTWSREFRYGTDMIYLAYEETLDHSGKISFAYMNKVLANWHEKGLKTPSDVENDKQTFREKKSRKAAKNNDADTSYDMNEFNRRANQLPVYKKGG
ncbi:MAG: DnaD domain protein [Clostridia bacterium]|nr:DnaD domain protein [Clostridia bacterium]